MTDTAQELGAEVDAVVSEIHTFLDENYCQCGSLPEGVDCYWHKLFDIGVRLQAALGAGR